MRRRQLAVTAVLVVAVLVAGGGVAWWLSHRTTAFEQALGMLPQKSLRVTWTDWGQVRRLAHGSHLGPGSSRAQLHDFLDRAANRDLDSGSAIDDATYALAHLFGFSALDAQWEILGQGRQGQVDLVKVGPGVDMAGIENALRRLGYQPPASGSGTGGTWAGSPDLTARIDPSLSPIEQNFVVLSDQGVVMMSDDAAYLSAAADVLRDGAPSLLSVDGVGDLGHIARAPVNAVLWASTFACEDLSMGNASADDQRVAAALVSKAGGVNPLTGLVMARQASGEIEVGMHFDTAQEAADNLQPRVDLASGPAPGQGGSFRSRFTVIAANAQGQNISMSLAPRPHAFGVLSDISQGPVLFATC